MQQLQPEDLIRFGMIPEFIGRLPVVSVLDHLTDFLNSGGRKVDAWYSTLRLAEVAFDDQEEAFSNINTSHELKTFEAGI